MALACPQCGGAGQVLRLEAFWRSLSQDAEAKRDLACPSAYRVAWLWPAGGLVLAAIGHSAAVLLASLVVAAWMWRGYTRARTARERWARSLYCRHCPSVFDPEG